MSAPRPPDDFEAPERALWRRSHAALVDMGVWQDADRDALERFCRASAMSRLTRERIAARGRVDPESAWLSLGSMRQTITHPDVELERRARLDAQTLADALGLTPMARKRLLGVPAVPDELDAFLSEISGGR